MDIEHQVTRTTGLHRLRNEIVSTISHEFRTPLTSIIGFAESLLSDPEMMADKRMEYTRIIKDEGERLARLISDLMYISALEQQDASLIRCGEYNLVSILKHAVDAVSVQAEKRNISVKTEFDQPQCYATVDKERIFEVALHLLDNAMKFTPNLGTITVRMHEQNESIDFEVSDDGIGIPEKDIPFVFDHFYKVRRAGEETRGAGLGLAIARHLVELHGGSIFVNSTENAGSTFTVSLPKRNS